MFRFTDSSGRRSVLRRRRARLPTLHPFIYPPGTCGSVTRHGTINFFHSIMIAFGGLGGVDNCAISFKQASISPVGLSAGPWPQPPGAGSRGLCDRPTPHSPDLGVAFPKALSPFLVRGKNWRSFTQKNKYKKKSHDFFWKFYNKDFKVWKQRNYCDWEKNNFIF